MAATIRIVRWSALIVLVGFATAWAQLDERGGVRAPSTATAASRCPSIEATGAGSEAGPRISIEEKKRVPKDRDKDKKEGDQKTDSKTESESSEDETCFGSCIDVMFSSIFSSGSDKTGTPAPVAATPPPPLPVQGLPPVTAAATPEVGIIGLGKILHPDSLDAPVQVWDGPGGLERGYARVAAVKHGTEIEVLSTRAFGTGDWVQVRTRSVPPATGWVSAAHVDWVASAPLSPVTLAPRTPVSESPVAPAAAPAAAAPSFEVRAPLGFVIITDFAYIYMPGPAELREEYRDGGLRFGVQALVVPVGSLHLSFGLGYAHEHGYPQFEYETPTQRETPVRSSLNVFDAGLRLGQYAQIGNTMGRIYWGVGPAFFWVYEVARLDIYRMPTGEWIDRRFESLHRARLGGDAAVGASWQLADRVHVGGLMRAFVIPWYSQERKSLTLDFLGDRSLVGLGLSASLTIDAF